MFLSHSHIDQPPHADSDSPSLNHKNRKRPRVPVCTDSFRPFRRLPIKPQTAQWAFLFKRLRLNPWGRNFPASAPGSSCWACTKRHGPWRPGWNPSPAKGRRGCPPPPEKRKKISPWPRSERAGHVNVSRRAQASALLCQLPSNWWLAGLGFQHVPGSCGYMGHPCTSPPNHRFDSKPPIQGKLTSSHLRNRLK